MHAILFLRSDKTLKQSFALLLFICLASLKAYQWPSTAQVKRSFLQQSQEDGGFNFGVHFENPEQAVAFAEGEIIYHNAESHLASLPGGNIVVLEHKDWLLSHYARNMSTTFDDPAAVEEEELLLSQVDKTKESELYIEFYDYKRDRLISPWLMLPSLQSSTPQTSRQLVVVIEASNFRTVLRNISYFYEQSYSLLLSANRTPLWLESDYASQELRRLDLSSVSERQGLLYTDNELTAVDSLAVAGLLKIAEFEITPPLRGIKPMTLRFSFDGNQVETDNYNFYTLPPENGS